MTPKEILDHPIVGGRYFFPRKSKLPDPFVVMTDGVALHCHRSATHEGGPWLLHFHGNGEVVADWVPALVPALSEAGINVALGEYRGYGGSSGLPALASMLDDALAITDALSVDPGQLVVYGRSVGSIYALHVGAHRPIAGLVIESGISDVLQRLRSRLKAAELGVQEGELCAASDALLDHQRKLEAHGGPVLVLHAHNDVLVRPEHGIQLASWAGERARLHLFERGDHNTIHAFNGPQILAEVADFVHSTTGL